MGKKSQTVADPDSGGLFLPIHLPSSREPDDEQEHARVLLFSRLFRTWMTLQTSLNRRFLGFRMSAQEADVLLRCVEAGQINPGRLAILLGKDKGKITRFVDRLETRNLVKQKINPRDRRYFVVRPTGKGKKTAQKLACLFESVRKELFAGITEDRLSQLSATLVLLQANAATIGSPGVAWLAPAEERGLELSLGMEVKAVTQLEEREASGRGAAQPEVRDSVQLDLNR